MDENLFSCRNRCSQAAALLILSLVLIDFTGKSQTIDIKLSGTNVVLSWTGSNLWPQANGTLDQPSEWQNIFGVTGSGSGLTLVQPATADQLFFRLVSSPDLPPPTRLFLDGRDDRFFLYWDAVSNAVAYNLYYGTEAGISQSNYLSKAGGTKLSGITVTSLTISNLVPGQTYYFIVTATNNAGESVDSIEVAGAYGPHGEVHGTVYTELAVGAQTNQFFLPGVAVYLINQSNQFQSASVTSDSQGSFVFPPQPYGNYQLCWTAPGFAPGCSTQEVAVVGDPIYLEPEKLVPLPGPGLVYGRVLLQNGQAPLQSDPFFDINVNAQISLRRTNGTVVGSTTPNSLGDYVLANVPRSDALELRAEVEAGQVITNISTFVTGQADLVLPNSPPVIRSLRAIWNGQPTNRVSPGATVSIVAVADDPDAGDVLQYRWFPSRAADGLVDTNLPATTLTVSNEPGAVVLFVRVNDGRGGYATERLDLAVTDEWLFTGYVHDTNHLPILDASVAVGGVSTFSDTNGYFSLTVPASQDTYPLIITAAGFSPLFRYYTAPATEVEYVLRPIGHSICTNWAGEPITFDDGNGTSLSLQPFSLTNSAGQSYIGDLCVTITTFDPCDFSAPISAGNDALDNLLHPVFLPPVAGATIRITDGTNELFIRADAPALLMLPRGLACVPPTNEASALPSWHLDPASGLWRPTGYQASRQINADTSLSFIGPIIQLGLLAVGQPAEVCTVTVDADRTINYPFEVRVTDLPEPALIELDLRRRSFKAPQNKDLTIDVISHKESPGVYYTNPLNPNSERKLPDKTAIVRVKTKFTQAGATVFVSLSNHIAAMRSERVEDGDHFLTYRSTGKLAGGNFQNGDAYYGATAGDPGVFNSPYRINRFKFRDFLLKNKFLPAPGNSFANFTEDAGALYYNAQDLGFARSMHMKRSVGADGKTNIAFFVINYFRLEDAMVDHETNGKLKQLNAQVNGRGITTVAMDYAWDPRWQKRYTKFYVFDGGLFGDLRPDADLDGANNGGGKPVPNLCVNCHAKTPITVKRLKASDVWPNGRDAEVNASYLRTNLNFKDQTLPIEKLVTNITWIDDGVTVRSGNKLVPSILVMDPPDGDTGARFLPFDLESFTYASGVGVAEAQFRELNRGIYLYTPLTLALTNLLEGWYGGPLNAGNNSPFVPNFVPAAWAGEATLYRDVVRVSCRACHSTRAGGLGFAASADFTKRENSLHSQICSDLTMPNAQRTFSIFWGSETANFIKPGAVPDQIKVLTNKFSWKECPTK